MSETKQAPAVDGPFSTFMFGLTLGIAGALLLGTEEGRKASKQILNSLSEGLEKNKDLFAEAKNVGSQMVHEVQSQFGQPQSYLPDQPARNASSIADAGGPTTRYEPPPPLPPHTNRPRPNPTYFESNGNPLEP
ncbi:hypothetical protein A3A84_02955 [Candidatus Collierbacteria bacterium RIFCSPLOWO2_01_FULL_50_23]|nr:MAG: hypothetical protein A3A84_02955 [Candidatus Collierbacteria bacterium RIFCSPLOWO2_01_FULL_50_23]